MNNRVECTVYPYLAHASVYPDLAQSIRWQKTEKFAGPTSTERQTKGSEMKRVWAAFDSHYFDRMKRGGEGECGSRHSMEGFAPVSCQCDRCTAGKNGDWLTNFSITDKWLDVWSKRQCSRPDRTCLRRRGEWQEGSLHSLPLCYPLKLL